MTEHNIRVFVNILGILVILICFLLYVLSAFFLADYQSSLTSEFSVQSADEKSPNKLIWLSDFYLYLIEFIQQIIVAICGATVTAIGAWFFFIRYVEQARDREGRRVDPEVEVMENLISAGKAKSIKGAEGFSERFELDLKNCSESVHIAVMTSQAITHYSSPSVKEKWKSKSPEKRRRIAVLLHGSDNEAEYTDKIPELIEFFDQTANTAFIWMDTLENEPDLQLTAQKDCAIMFNNHKIERSYISYIERGSNYRFTKSPSTQFYNDGNDFNLDLLKNFNKIWSDEKVSVVNQRIRDRFT